MLRLVDAYNLYLRELMQAVQSANILAVAPSLTAETLCVCAVLDGQVFLVEDNVAVDVCYMELHYVLTLLDLICQLSQFFLYQPIL